MRLARYQGMKLIDPEQLFDNLVTKDAKGLQLRSQTLPVLETSACSLGIWAMKHLFCICCLLEVDYVVPSSIGDLSQDRQSNIWFFFALRQACLYSYSSYSSCFFPSPSSPSSSSSNLDLLAGKEIFNKDACWYLVPGQPGQTYSPLILTTKSVSTVAVFHNAKWYSVRYRIFNWVTIFLGDMGCHFFVIFVSPEGFDSLGWLIVGFPTWQQCNIFGAFVHQGLLGIAAVQLVAAVNKMMGAPN